MLSLSHGDAVPERGFSINKILLDAHGPNIGEDKIVQIRLVEDELHRLVGPAISKEEKLKTQRCFTDF